MRPPGGDVERERAAGGGAGALDDDVGAATVRGLADDRGDIVGAWISGDADPVLLGEPSPCVEGVGTDDDRAGRRGEEGGSQPDRPQPDHGHGVTQTELRALERQISGARAAGVVGGLGEADAVGDEHAVARPSDHGSRIAPGLSSP